MVERPFPPPEPPAEFMGEPKETRHVKVPKYIADQYGGVHAFKAAKRRELKEVLRAISELRKGCAFLPSGLGLIDAAREKLQQIQKELSVKNWGR